MGIKGLAKLLADHAPGAMREQKFEDYFGRKIAIDASMHIYQFLVVVGRTGDQMLTNEAGDVTSHLQGMFFRTARMLESGMKPVYIFDGKPPDAKKEELNRRFEKRGDATEDLEKAKETGTTEDVAKYSKRTVRVTKEHNDDCKRLLKLMGVPIIEAPSEAEAQCAAMCKDELVYAMASEDMDSLTFGTPRLTRNLMKPANAKVAINEYEYQKVLEELKLTAEQFVDVCILCGCDYAGTIRGIGAGKAYNLVQKHGSLEGVLANLDKDKYPVPDPYPYEEARRLFREPQVMRKDEIPAMKWGSPDEAGLVTFLVTEKGFNEDRVRKVAERIRGSKGKSNQGRLESFFGAPTVKTSDLGVKRKEAEQKGGAAKKGKLNSGGAKGRAGSKAGAAKTPKK